MEIPQKINNRYEEFYHEDKRIVNLVLYLRDIIFDDLSEVREDENYPKCSFFKILNEHFPYNPQFQFDDAGYYLLYNTTKIYLPEDSGNLIEESINYVIEQKVKQKEELSKLELEERIQSFLNGINEYMFRKELPPNLLEAHRRGRMLRFLDK